MEDPLSSAQRFLNAVLPNLGAEKGVLEARADRPHVTLTYAQSLDGKIAGKGGVQLPLSGNESWIMTHWWVQTL